MLAYCGIIYTTMQSVPEIVIDTNVMVAGLRSRGGSAFRLLNHIGSGRFGINLSVALVLEYEAVLTRTEPQIAIGRKLIGDVIDYHCSVARHHRIHFLWRPQLRDPKDDMVLELAVNSGSHCIVTYNVRDFAGCGRFGVRAVTPRWFLNLIGVE